MKKIYVLLIILSISQLSCRKEQLSSSAESETAVQTENNPGNIKVLSTKRIDDMSMDELLIFSIKTGDVEKLNKAIKNGADVNTLNEHNVPAVISAVLYTQLIMRDEILMLLLDSGANVDVEFDGKSPLVFAAEIGKPPTIDLLLKKNADIFFTGKETVLTAAVKRGHIKTVKHLAALGADVNAVNSEGKNPVELSKENDYPLIIPILESEGE